MNREAIMELIQRNLDGDLTEVEQAQLHSALRANPEMKCLNERLQSVSDELTQLPKVTPPFSIVDSILPRLESTAGPEQAAALQASAAGLASSAEHAELPRLQSKQELPAAKKKSLTRVWLAKAGTGLAAACLLIGLFAIANHDKKEPEDRNSASVGSPGEMVAINPEPDDKQPASTLNQGKDNQQTSANTPTPPQTPPVQPSGNQTPPAVKEQPNGNAQTGKNGQSVGQQPPGKSQANHQPAGGEKSGKQATGNQRPNADGNKGSAKAIAPAQKDQQKGNKGAAGKAASKDAKENKGNKNSGNKNNGKEKDENGQGKDWEEEFAKKMQELQEMQKKFDEERDKNREKVAEELRKALNKLKEEIQKEQEKRKKGWD